MGIFIVRAILRPLVQTIVVLGKISGVAETKFA